MSNNYTDIILEEIRDQNKAILEAVGGMQEQVAKIPRMEEKIDKLGQDLRVVKAAVTDTNHEVRALDRRVTRLEARA